MDDLDKVIVEELDKVDLEETVEAVAEAELKEEEDLQVILDDIDDTGPPVDEDDEQLCFNCKEPVADPGTLCADCVAELDEDG